MLCFRFILGCILSIINLNLFAQTFPNETPTVIKKPKIKSSIKLKNAGDTLQIDTIVIVYKKKDTSLALKRYKGRIPLIQVNLGGFKNNDKLNVPTMQALLDSGLNFKDKEGRKYKVLNYRFCYKKKDVYIEDEGMAVKTRYDLCCFQAQESPLPLKFKKNIQSDILSEEQFWFENIIVENERGEKFLTSDVSLITY